MRLLNCLAAAVLVSAVSPALAFTVTKFPTHVSGNTWGAADASLGVAGYTIEDFEDTQLAAGLQVGRQVGTTVTQALSSTLHSADVFSPANDPQLYNGQPLSAFQTGVWDGSHVLINNPGPGSNETNWYNTNGNWGTLNFSFSGVVTSVGFSVEQAERSGDKVYVNGVLLFDIFDELGGVTDTQAGFTFTGRNGYLRIDAGAGESITTVQITSGNTDGFAIDHMAFRTERDASTVPEPASLALAAVALVSMALVRRRSGG